MHADEHDELIERVADALKRPAPLSAGFDAKVMARVRAARPESLVVRAWHWAKEPRAVVVSPVMGLALAACLALVVTGAGWLTRHSRLTPNAPAASFQQPASSAVQFVLLAPQARTVSLAGDFNGWDASRTQLVRSASGMWTVDVPLAPGRYTYAFVVDGRRFIPDPAAPRAVGDDFGTPSSVVTVNGGGKS